MHNKDSDDEAFESKQAYQNEVVKDLDLPEWLTNEFPEHLPHITISFKDGAFYTSDRSKFSTIEEAYDYASSYSATNQVVFDSSVDGHGGRLHDFGMFFCQQRTASGNTRVLHGFATESIVSRLKHDYLSWLTDVCIDYNSDPDNFVTAHKWLSHHPVFWLKGTKEKSFNWVTDAGLAEMPIIISIDPKTAKTVVFLQHGPHDTESFTFHWLNDLLSVREETFEDSIILLAKKVNTEFDTDGYYRVPRKSPYGD